MINQNRKVIVILGLACMVVAVIIVFMKHAGNYTLDDNTADAGGSMVFKRALGSGIFKTNNPDEGWNSVSKGLLSKSDVLTLAAIGNTVYAGTSLGDIFVWDRQNNAWAHLPTGINSGSILCMIQSGNSLLAGTYWGGVMSSTDQGKSWSKSNKGLKNKRVFSLLANKGIVYAATYGGGVFTSTNDGSTWQKSDSGLTSKHTLALMAIGNSLFSSTEYSGVFRSDDKGKSWVHLAEPFNQSEVLCFTVIENILFAGTNGAGLFRSTDFGESWEHINAEKAFEHVNCLAYNDGKLYAGTDDKGVFVSTDNGTEWTTLNKGFQQTTSVWCLTAGNSELFAGAGTVSDSRQKILSKAVPGSETMTSEIPEAFVLSQNFPNPFNASTTINYVLPEQSSVTIRIYDITGREVVNITRDENSGEHSYVWDASNVASGTYIYRVEAVSSESPSTRFTDTKKMTLLK